MARQYTNITTRIWKDPEFRALPVEPQLAYLMLVTQDNITSCGLLPLTLRRWSGNSAGWSSERLSDSIQMLCEARFLVVDWDSEEVLVRTFVKHDGGYKIPNRRAAVVAAAEAINSPELSQVVALELDKLGVAHHIQVMASECHSDAIAEESESLRVVVLPKVTTEPQPLNHNPQPTTPDRPRAEKRGTRLPPDWQPDPDLVRFVQAECPDVDGRTETANFRDYWHAKAGRDAIKLDWPATYRKWMRTAQAAARRPSRAGPGRSTTDQRVADGLDLAARLAAQERQPQLPPGDRHATV